MQTFSPRSLEGLTVVLSACSEVHARGHTVREERLPGLGDRVGDASARVPAVGGQLLGPSVFGIAARILPQGPEKHSPQDVLRHSEFDLG